MPINGGRGAPSCAAIVLIHGLLTTTITPDSEVIAEHLIDPNKSYQAKE